MNWHKKANLKALMRDTSAIFVAITTDCFRHRRATPSQLRISHGFSAISPDFEIVTKKTTLSLFFKKTCICSGAKLMLILTWNLDLTNGYIFLICLTKLYRKNNDKCLIQFSFFRFRCLFLD